jgi:hypothetical protein
MNSIFTKRIVVFPDTGPCVAVLHDDFDGNVALDGMNSKEFQERVYVSTYVLVATLSCY